MIFRISYFVTHSPNCNEAVRHDNFCLGSMSVLLHQFKYYYICYFKTGDAKQIFGAVYTWADVGQNFSQQELILSALPTPPGDLEEHLTCWSKLLSLCLSCYHEYMIGASDVRTQKLIPATHCYKALLFPWVFLSHVPKSLSTWIRKGMNAMVGRTLSIKNYF